MGIKLVQESFVDDKKIRDKHIGRIEVLDKVKVLSMLPDGEHMTVKLVADHFEVDEGAIKMLVHRHRDELNSDGLRNLSGIELSNIKLLCDMKSNKSRAMIIFNRRSILRVAMLLRDSEVAKQVRTYLLNIEQDATQQQKAKATKGSSWDKNDIILYDQIIVTTNAGGNLTEACEIVAPKIGKTVGACMNRYSQTIKKKIQNVELINRIEGKKHGHLKLDDRISIDPVDDVIPVNEHCRIPTWQELILNEIVQMNTETNEMVKTIVAENSEMLKSQNEKLINEIKSWKVKYKKVNEELKLVQAVVASAIKVGVNETLQQTFKMERNGNLEKI